MRRLTKSPGDQIQEQDSVRDRERRRFLGKASLGVVAILVAPFRALLGPRGKGPPDLPEDSIFRPRQ